MRTPIRHALPARQRSLIPRQRDDVDTPRRPGGDTLAIIVLIAFLFLLAALFLAVLAGGCWITANLLWGWP